MHEMAHPTSGYGSNYGVDSSGVGVVDRADSPYSRVGKKIRRSRTRTKIKRPDSTRIESGLLAFVIAL